MNLQQQAVASALEKVIENQSFYRKYANTINGVIASAASMLVFVLTWVQTSGQYNSVATVLAFIVPIVTGVSLRLTENGIGKGQAMKVVMQAGQSHAPEASLPAFQVERD